MGKSTFGCVGERDNKAVSCLQSRPARLARKNSDSLLRLCMNLPTAKKTQTPQCLPNDPECKKGLKVERAPVLLRKALSKEVEGWQRAVPVILFHS